MADLDQLAIFFAMLGSSIGVCASFVPGRLGAFLGLPGTVVHETAHWLAALFLGARPGLISVIPQERDGYLVRGYVRVHRLGWFSTAPVALAPLPCGLAAAWLAFDQAIASEVALGQIGWGFLAGSFTWACLPSEADLRLALSKPLGFVPLCGVGYLGWMLFV